MSLYLKPEKDEELSSLEAEVTSLEAEIDALGWRIRSATVGGSRRRPDIAIQPCRTKRILPFALRSIEGSDGDRYEIFLPNHGEGLIRVGLHPLRFGGYFANNWIDPGEPDATVIPADGWLDIGGTWDAELRIDTENDCWTLHRANDGWGDISVNEMSFDTLGCGVREWGFMWPEQTYRELGDTEDYQPILRDEPCGVCFKAIDGFELRHRYDRTTHTSWDELYVGNIMVYQNRFGIVIKTEDAGYELFTLPCQ